MCAGLKTAAAGDAAVPLVQGLSRLGRANRFMFDGGETRDGKLMLAAMLTTVDSWLGARGVDSSLHAAEGVLPVYGLDFRALRTAAQEVLAARDAADAADRSAATMQALAQKLMAVGRAFTAVLVRAACNNPSCNGVSGPTELSNVAGPGRKCGACRAAHYCCTACQRRHWGQHKPVCKALAAPPAASAASAADVCSSCGLLARGAELLALVDRLGGRRVKGKDTCAGHGEHALYATPDIRAASTLSAVGSCCMSARMQNREVGFSVMVLPQGLLSPGTVWLVLGAPSCHPALHTPQQRATHTTATAAAVDQSAHCDLPGQLRGHKSAL